MSKKSIRLTESQLRQMVRESVDKVLQEVSFQTAQAAYQASQDPNRPISPAMQRRMANNQGAFAQQRGNLKQGASNAFNRDYGYNLKNVPYGSGDDSEMTVADQNKPFYGGGNLYAPKGDYFDSAAGKGPDNVQRNTRATQYWGNNPGEYNQKGINISAKDQIMNPKWANAVRRGEKALDNTVQQR